MFCFSFKNIFDPKESSTSFARLQLVRHNIRCVAYDTTPVTKLQHFRYPLFEIRLNFDRTHTRRIMNRNSFGHLYELIGKWVPIDLLLTLRGRYVNWSTSVRVRTRIDRVMSHGHYWCNTLWTLAHYDALYYYPIESRFRVIGKYDLNIKKTLSYAYAQYDRLTPIAWSRKCRAKSSQNKN